MSSGVEQAVKMRVIKYNFQQKVGDQDPPEKDL